jgi:hypothetical protein
MTHSAQPSAGGGTSAGGGRHKFSGFSSPRRRARWEETSGRAGGGRALPPAWATRSRRATAALHAGGARTLLSTALLLHPAWPLGAGTGAVGNGCPDHRPAVGHRVPCRQQFQPGKSRHPDQRRRRRHLLVAWLRVLRHPQPRPQPQRRPGAGDWPAGGRDGGVNRAAPTAATTGPSDPCGRTSIGCGRGPSGSPPAGGGHLHRARRPVSAVVSCSCPAGRATSGRPPWCCRPKMARLPVTKARFCGEFSGEFYSGEGVAPRAAGATSCGRCRCTKALGKSTAAAPSARAMAQIPRRPGWLATLPSTPSV